MSSLIRMCKKLAFDESGQAITEYVLVLSLTVAGAGLIMSGLIKVIDEFTKVFGAQLEKDLKSGRAPSAVWKN